MSLALFPGRWTGAETSIPPRWHCSSGSQRENVLLILRIRAETVQPVEFRRSTEPLTLYALIAIFMHTEDGHENNPRFA